MYVAVPTVYKRYHILFNANAVVLNVRESSMRRVDTDKNRTVRASHSLILILSCTEFSNYTVTRKDVKNQILYEACSTVIVSLLM